MIEGSIAVAGRLLLGSVFVYASASKIARRARSADASLRLMTTLGLRETRTVGRIVRLIPLGELVIGAALIAGLFGVVGVLLATVLLIVFTLVVALAFRKGFRGDCGCIGPKNRQGVGVAHLFVNCLLVGAGTLSFAIYARSGVAMEPMWRLSAEDAVAAVVAVGLFVLLSITAYRIQSLWRQVRQPWREEL